MLHHSPTIKRAIRQDPPEQLGRPSRPFLEAAMRTGRIDEARQWLDYLLAEAGGIHYLLGVWNWYMVRAVLDRDGEKQWPALVARTVAPWLTTTAGMRDLGAVVVETDGLDAVCHRPGCRRTST